MGDKEELGEGGEIIYETLIDFKFKSSYLPLIYKDKMHRYLVFIDFNSTNWNIIALDIHEHITDGSSSLTRCSEKNFSPVLN